jgi:HD-like signal output (HDOD) protein
MTVEKDAVQKVVNRLKDIPTLPSVIHKIIEIVDSPNTSASDLNKAISMDQALSAKVLKLVNSAFYGFPKKIETLTQAIVILGFNTVRSLALSISMVDFLTGRPGKHQLNYSEFWKHSIGVSIMARAIAKKAFPPLAEESFVAGLLHDIGVLIFDQFLPNEYGSAIALMHEEKIPLYQAEQKALQITHCDVGRMLAVKWNLPDTLLHAIAYHHNPSPSRDHFAITAVIHAANVGAKLLKLGGTGDEDYIRTFHISEEARRVLHLDLEFPENLREFAEHALVEGEEFIATITKK